MLKLTSINPIDLWFYVAKYFQVKPARVMASTLALLAIFIYRRRQHPRTPRLQGPHSESFLLGINKKLFPTMDIGPVYQDWERRYGPVFEIPAGMGTRHIVLSDPKAIAYFFSKDTTTYHQPTLQKTVFRGAYGDLLTAMEGETHKRQRRALSSAFSIAAIRDLTPVFLDSAYKVKAAWDASLQALDSSAGVVTVDVQKWMNCTSLDSIGKAGFSHDFGTLSGQESPVMAALDSFNTVKPSLPIMIYLTVGPLFPNLFSMIRVRRQEKLVDVVANLGVIATDLLSKASKETEDHKADRSILGVMIRSESASSNIRLSTDEIISQNMFILTGYETTALTMTWAFIELARRPDIQEILRAELRDFFAFGEDPTYDQLMNDSDLPYLDAFTCEILRLHPALPQIMREAKEDDTIPLTEPIRTASGKLIDSLFVEKGTVVRIPFAGVNMSEALWGSDAGTLNLGRWLVSNDDNDKRREEIKGFRHLLTFSHGPRMCPARNLAVVEIKVVISVLVRNFAFEFPNGPSTKLESHFLHPKVVGEEGIQVPVLVRKVK